MINSFRLKMYSFFKNSSCLSSQSLRIIISDLTALKEKERKYKNIKR